MPAQPTRRYPSPFSCSSGGNPPFSERIGLSEAQPPTGLQRHAGGLGAAPQAWKQSQGRQAQSPIPAPHCAGRPVKSAAHGSPPILPPDLGNSAHCPESTAFGAHKLTAGKNCLYLRLGIALQACTNPLEFWPNASNDYHPSEDCSRNKPS